MKKKILLATLALFLSIFSLLAQDKINGHWTGMVMEQYKVAFDFKQQGESLTGKDTHYDGTVSDISNGRIKGDTLSFDVPVRDAMTHMTGKLTDAGLTLKFAVQGNDVILEMKKEEKK